MSSWLAGCARTLLRPGENQGGSVESDGAGLEHLWGC